MLNYAEDDKLIMKNKLKEYLINKGPSDPVNLIIHCEKCHYKPPSTNQNLGKKIFPRLKPTLLRGKNQEIFQQKPLGNRALQTIPIDKCRNERNQIP